MKNTLYKSCSLFIVFSFSLSAFAQNDSLKIDSLKKVLATEKDDTNKVNTIIEIDSYLYGLRNYESVLEYTNRALSLSKNLNFKKGIGHAYIWMGNISSSYKYNYEEALKYYQAALSIFKEIDYKKGMANAYENISLPYDGLGNYPEVLKNIYYALKIYEEARDTENIIICLFNLSSTYSEQGNHEEAQKSSKAALNMAEKIGYKLMIASCFTSLADEYFFLKNYSLSMKYNIDALKLYRELGNLSPTWGVPWSYKEIGKNYKTIGDSAIQKDSTIAYYSKAIENYILALQEFEKVKDERGVAECYNLLGGLYIKLKDFTKASYYLEKSANTATAIGAKEELKNVYSSLAALDSSQGKFAPAFEHYKKYIIYRDSLTGDESTKKSLTYKMQYDFDKKETIAKEIQDKKDTEAKQIKSQQYFAIAALGIVVLAVIIIAMIQFRNNKQKQQANMVLRQQKEKVEITLTELKSTQAQLIQSEKMASLGELTAGIAHEIQNPLNFVNNFSEVNQEMIDEAREEIDKGNIEEVKMILSDIKDNSEKINHHGKRADSIVKGMLQHSKKTSGQKEPTDINALADEYLRLSFHGMRAKDKEFNAALMTDFDESIGNLNIIPQDISRVLLNLYNNAFYAVKEKQVSGARYEPTVSVSTKKTGNRVTITVSDNGNGIPQNIVDKIFQPFFTTKPTGQGTGLGLSLSYDIVKAHGGEIKVESKEGEGTMFIIQLSIT